MQRTNEDSEDPKSRTTSRRNSASRRSIKRDKELKKEVKKIKSPTAPSSSHSTPKRVVNKTQNLDFLVTGRQLLKRSDRANSLPGSCRRPSIESVKKKPSVSPKKVTPQSSRSKETSLEDNVSLLDLSQVTDFEDSKYGMPKKNALHASTPKNVAKNFQKRCGSLQSQMQAESKAEKRLENSRSNGSRDVTTSFSRDSIYKTSSGANSYRYGLSTELDYSSVSPEYSGTSAEASPRIRDDLVTPQDMTSCCLSTFQDYSERTGLADKRTDGEWAHFWANYNNSIATVPLRGYYDQCPTPYRTEDIDLADLDLLADSPRKRSPENVNNINSIIRNEGLHLTPRETQSIISCAHILGDVLTKAIERRSKEKDGDDDKIQEVKVVKLDKTDPETEIKKRTMTLELKETTIPVKLQEEKGRETVMTQTDISLPNTKSAPKIFEKILKQLSKSTLEECLEKTLEKEELKRESDNEIKKVE